MRCRNDLPSELADASKKWWQVPAGYADATGDKVTEEVLSRAGRYRTVAENLEVKEVIVGEG